MADSAIGDLDAALSIGSDDLFLMEQNGNAKKVPGSLQMYCPKFRKTL